MTPVKATTTKTRKLSLRVALIILSIWILIVVTLCFLLCSGRLLPFLAPLPTGTWEPEAANFQYVQHLPSPDNEHIFALFIDYTVPVGDTGWYIFKFEKDFDVENYQISWDEYQNGDYLKNVIMANYAEGGDHTKNPQIEIISDKYLVFTRGGLYHSLYDIDADKTLVESYSPWHDWRDSEEYKSIQPNPSAEEKERSIDKWKRENLHEPILMIIQGG